MTPVDVASILKDYGSTGAIAILCCVVVFLFKMLQDCQAAQLKVIERMAVQLQVSKDSDERLERTQASMMTNFEARFQAVDALSYQVRSLGDKQEHALGNIAQSQDAIVRILERALDRERK